MTGETFNHQIEKSMKSFQKGNYLTSNDFVHFMKKRNNVINRAGEQHDTLRDESSFNPKEYMIAFMYINAAILDELFTNRKKYYVQNRFYMSIFILNYPFVSLLI